MGEKAWPFEYHRESEMPPENEIDPNEDAKLSAKDQPGRLERMFCCMDSTLCRDNKNGWSTSKNFFKANRSDFRLQ